MTIKKDWGLVLAGGGGKGAYEIGMWKALKEREDLHISAVSGTSVGALNAALFSIGDYDTAQTIWENQIDEEVVLSPRIWKTEEFTDILHNILEENREWITDLVELPRRGNLSGMFLKIFAGKNATFNKLEEFFERPLAVSVFWLILKLAKRGAFTREGLTRIVEKNNILQEVKQSKIPCYAACYNIMSQSAEYFHLQQYEEDEILQILMASSALPFIFPPVEMNGAKYWDGGLKDNVPIRPLYDAGYRKLLVVHLDPPDDNLLWDYCDTVVVHFYPQKSLSGFRGTLDFNPKTIRRKMEQGYNETKKRLERIKA